MAHHNDFTFCSKDWKTPNTYDTNFMVPPDKPGIYLIIKPSDSELSLPDILYIGSAKSLSVRYARHEVLRMLKEFYGYVQFYFQECSDYRNKEKELIRIVQPKYNKQWR